MQDQRQQGTWFVRSKHLPWTRTPVNGAGWLVIAAAFLGFMAVGYGTVFAVNIWTGHEALAMALGIAAFLVVAFAVGRAIATHTGSER